MKVIIVLLALVGVGWLAVYYGGGYGSFDPSEQGRQAKAAVAPGMTHTQAFDACGEPRKVRRINRVVKKVAGRELVSYVPGPEAKTTRQRIGERIKAGDFPDGFVIPYRFSDSVAFAVKFDSQGIVESVYDLGTMADLLQYKD